MTLIAQKNLNAEALRKGIAKVDATHVDVRNDVHLKWVRQLMAAQKFAEKNRLGVWEGLEKEQIPTYAAVFKSKFDNLKERIIRRIRNI